jgi:hypothetical protein
MKKAAITDTDLAALTHACAEKTERLIAPLAICEEASQQGHVQGRTRAP